MILLTNTEAVRDLFHATIRTETPRGQPSAPLSDNPNYRNSRTHAARRDNRETQRHFIRNARLCQAVTSNLNRKLMKENKKEKTR